MPPGFTATPFATGLANPRRLLVLPNGDVLVAEQSAGYLTLLRDVTATAMRRGSSATSRISTGPMASPGGTTTCWSPTRTASGGCRICSARCARGARQQQRVEQVPPEDRKPVPGAYGAQMLTKKGVFGIAQGHQNRPLAVDPEDRRPLRRRRVVRQSRRRARAEGDDPALRRGRLDTRRPTPRACATRPPSPSIRRPATSGPSVQERDGLGDHLPSDYLIRVQEGGFYGWPYAYIGKHPQPGFANLAPDKVEATITPDLLFEAHSSVLDLVFYDADQFPAEYKGNAFVALKGSWNRSEPTGYKVVRVPFKDGKPEGYYENFMTGFWASGERRAEVWGRPAALAVAKDGALLVADDTGGTIWRVSYTQKTQ